MFDILDYKIEPVENGYVISAKIGRKSGRLNQFGGAEWEYKIVQQVAQGHAEEIGTRIAAMEQAVMDGAYE